MSKKKRPQPLNDDLFRISNTESPTNRLYRCNSWVDNPMFRNKFSPSPRRHSTGCIGLKKRKNLKDIFLNFITTDFDKKLIKYYKTMRKSSKRILSYLYNNSEKMLEYNNNAVSNLILLMLTDGNKNLNKQKVKYNIHFFLKLAEMAYENGDHQTGLLIKIALDNYNIKRLKLKFNKKDEGIYRMLDVGYGGNYNQYITHCVEFIEKFKLNDSKAIVFNEDYIPSSIIIYLYSNCNKDLYNNNFTRLGKIPKEKIESIKNLNKLKKYYYNKYLFNDDIKLSNLYKKSPNNINIVKNDENELLSDILFKLSINIKNIDANKNINLDEELKIYNRMFYCK
jgi:hypothetical protein